MEKENSGSFEYMGRSFSELSVNDDSSAFSDCNSDRSGEFQTRQKEIAVSILLQICEDNLVFRAMVTREGAIPPLVALTQSGTNRAKQKAETLIDLLRQPRSGNAAVGRTSDVSG
ncbi:hypothetical protein OIU77_009793 [Salix suchowensis]|uniref:Uncharacterized protein n=2 Tax=Salix TaxID=40685 RepID=A0AAD6J7T1_9ROSI|nr:hypothetical protein OIU77_009793 [Salix suchowensis]KAJ6399930.1 hypothetical protein OIU84_015562 [Salix udensis]